MELNRPKESVEYKTFSSMLKLTNNIVDQYIEKGTCPNCCENLSIKNSGDKVPMYIVSFNSKEDGSRWDYIVITLRVDNSTDTSIFMYSRFNEALEKEYEYFVASERCDVLSRRCIFNGHIKELENRQEKKNTSFSFRDETDCIIQSLVGLQSKIRTELNKVKELECQS